MSLDAATVSTTIEASIEEAFGQIVPIDLTSIFTGYGPLPAVVQTRDQSGAWDAAGRTRTVAFADGSTAQPIGTASRRGLVPWRYVLA